MDRVLSAMENVVCFLDDILITTRSIEKHKEILSEIAIPNGLKSCMSSTTSGATIDKLRYIYASYGLPEERVFDNGPRFVFEDFDMFLKRNVIKHTLIPPYHPANVLPSIELEKTCNERVAEDKDLPSKKSPEKEDLQIESEVQKFPEVKVAKSPDVSFPAKTPERRYPARIRRLPRFLDWGK
eukprot:gene11272-21465_t